MKLLFCLHCQDVLKLQIDTTRYCDCGKSWGAYSGDGLNATFGGEAVPLGIANQSFAEAYKLSKLTNNEPDLAGIRFEAFIIPEPCRTIRRE